MGKRKGRRGGGKVHYATTDPPQGEYRGSTARRVAMICNIENKEYQSTKRKNCRVFIVDTVSIGYQYGRHRLEGERERERGEGEREREKPTRQDGSFTLDTRITVLRHVPSIYCLATPP